MAAVGSSPRQRLPQLCEMHCVCCCVYKLVVFGPRAVVVVGIVVVQSNCSSREQKFKVPRHHTHGGGWDRGRLWVRSEDGGTEGGGGRGPAGGADGGRVANVRTTRGSSNSKIGRVQLPKPCRRPGLRATEKCPTQKLKSHQSREPERQDWSEGSWAH